MHSPLYKSKLPGAWPGHGIRWPLRASALGCDDPGGATGARRQLDKPPCPRPSTSAAAATRIHAWGPRRSGTEGRKLATHPRPTKPARGAESRLREAGDGAPATAGRQLSKPRGLREPLQPAPACPQRRKHPQTFGSLRGDVTVRVTGLEQRMGSLEMQINTSQEREQDFLYLRSKLTDMEDRSRRDNIRLLGIPENEEGSDMQAFLSSILPKMTSLDFDPPLEFQRAHRIGPKRSDNSSRPRPIIACLLRHNQTRQILQVVRSHGPFRIDQHEIRISADYSKETNERRKAFLALRPRLRKLEMKYGLFDPARMWVTKNGVSKDFYNPDELRLFLDSFQPQPMDSISTDCAHVNEGGSGGVETPHLGKGKMNTALYDAEASHRGRDMERLTRSYDDSGQILHAVVTHTQLSERDKSRSPLKPTTGSS
ncbi:hypothetical protein NDU88_002650 [Pleurodeles waltl]|uniref:L1 transposable element RRM domain-containing protein n=1 Tax=Pleurodeles waltl TaxID=8319 RepID=A0AAV7VD71_PLEWA|nr:hypothetical protein NDU88_002650 [Pleurodeles waltl]